MSFKQKISYLLPPVVVDVAQKLNRKLRPGRVEWEYVPGGWKTEQTDPKVKGWNVEEVVATYQAKWPGFLASLQGTSPIAVPIEAPSPDYTSIEFHNTAMTYAYVLSLAARHTASLSISLSMLDWGGGIGHYYAIGQALQPDLKIDYHCKDVPVHRQFGQNLFPEAHFYSDDHCLDRRYDLVMASGSLQFSQDWPSTLRRLAQAATGYLFITHTPFVDRSSSFVVVQRAYAYGYNTEYLGWCVNRQEFLQQTEASGMRMVREFLLGFSPYIHGAPEQCTYRGYLFQSVA